MGTGIASLLSIFFPQSLAVSVRNESKATIGHVRSWAKNRSRFRGQRGLKINVGCGPHPLPGWINIDLIEYSGVLCWDCRRKWPFDDSSASFIFAEHIFEHLDQPRETDHFLSESLRCLEPNGILRIIVPDAGIYLRLYNQPGWDELIMTRPLIRDGENFRDSRLGKVDVYATKMEMINAVFRQRTEHKYAYDAETLILRLKNAGFGEVAQQSFGQSFGPPPPDLPSRKSESLYVEAIK